MGMLLPKLIEKNVQSMPEHIAIIQNEQYVSYSELYSDICAVALYLNELELKPGAKVAILLDNSKEYIAAYYGILAAGCVAVGLNTATKRRDLVNWIRHSEAVCLIADAKHPELRSIIESLDNDLLYVVIGDDEETSKYDNVTTWQEVTGISHNNILICNASEEDLAAIIYTSGTTGNPKGVMLSHRNLADNNNSIVEYLKLRQTDKVMNVLPFYYSYGNSVLHTHLAVGATIILENSLLYPKKILEVIQKEKATGFSGVPSTFSLLLSRTKLNEYDLGSLRYMTQAGGAMAPSSIRRVIETLPDLDFYVMYGQTEATARLSYLPPMELEKKMGSVGMAIPGVSLEIRDKSGKKVPPGKQGQIYASGSNIMMGYWKDDNTTKSVIKDGWLMTGDLAVYDDDGYIYINGRSSEMIKSGANRISPKEIEEVISELEGIEEVAAVGVPDDLLGQIIKVVIVTSPGVSLKKMQIQSYCRENLAIYKIPKIVEFVTELPKTASGKVKRYLLAEAV
jgi:acyl-CoA synthetase (AMP-forming)/AMP-acid ligase II